MRLLATLTMLFAVVVVVVVVVVVEGNYSSVMGGPGVLMNEMTDFKDDIKNMAGSLSGRVKEKIREGIDLNKYVSKPGGVSPTEEKIGDAISGAARYTAEKAEEARKKTYQAISDASKKAQRLKEATLETTQKAVEEAQNVKENAQNVKDKAQQHAHGAYENVEATAQEAAVDTREKASWMKEKMKEWYNAIKKKGSDTLHNGKGKIINGHHGEDL